MARIISFHPSNKDEREGLFYKAWSSLSDLDRFTKLFITFSLLLILLTPIIITNYQIFTPQAATLPQPIKIALRVHDTTVFDNLDVYRTKATGAIPFVYYGNISFIKQISQQALSGTNPAQLGALIPCDDTAVSVFNQNLNSFITSHVTHIMQDCELGTDKIWGNPDISTIAAQMATQTAILNPTYNFHWQMDMQYGFVENKSNGQGGDTVVCQDVTNPNPTTSCDISSSYGAAVWNIYNANGIMTMFGQSGSQDTGPLYQLQNTYWLNYIHVHYPSNHWWAVSGLTDKNKDNIVDLNPLNIVDIAKTAQTMGADSLLIVWLGQNWTAMTGTQTQMPTFLDSWSQYVASLSASLSPTPTPTILPSPTPPITPPPPFIQPPPP